MSKIETGKQSIPRIPASNWWTLREKALKSPPLTVSIDYLQHVLEIGEGAAQNLIPNLRLLGLIDDNNKPTDDFNDWRHDETYQKYCQDILERTYPDELRAAEPPPNPVTEKVVRWFSRNKKVGEAAARQMASTYVLLANADPSIAKRAEQKSNTKTRSSTSSRLTIKQLRQDRGKPEKDAIESKTVQEKLVSSIQFNFQIHISPEASTEQIDQIFSSMAKHLRGITSPQ